MQYAHQVEANPTMKSVPVFIENLNINLTIKAIDLSNLSALMIPSQ